jgi:hypothetical protein
MSHSRVIQYFDFLAHGLVRRVRSNWRCFPIHLVASHVGESPGESISTSVSIGRQPSSARDPSRWPVCPVKAVRAPEPERSQSAASAAD